MFRYGAQGRRYNSIGPAHAVSLQEARDQARLCRKLLLDGIDPIAAKRARVAAAKAATATTQTFEQCAEACFDSHKQVWKNAKHRREWLASLAKFVHPAIGALPVAAIDTAMVLRVLGPIWTTLPETATRVRSRVEKVLDWARARGYRSGANPARWKGHLDHLLPAQPRAKRVVHHAALRYSDIPVFTQKLRQRNGSDARALEFIVLTAARSAEATNADWNEFDLANGIWTVPSGRMKTGKAHRVPLSLRVRSPCSSAHRRTAAKAMSFPVPIVAGQSGALQSGVSQGNWQEWISRSTDFEVLSGTGLPKRPAIRTT